MGEGASGMKVPPRSRGSARVQARRSFVARRVVLPAQAFIHTEGLSSGVLLLAALVALIWANSPWAGSYFRFQETEFAIEIGGVDIIRESLQHWINDGLMAIFFFVVGLEIKRELLEGQLSDLRRAALPVAAALGGMVVPALIYAALNAGQPTSRGWGIPMATDIAFALGVLSTLGRRIPPQVRVFLLALAIVDDLGAILVIAVFYSGAISFAALGLAAGLLGLILLMNWGRVRSLNAYLFMGLLFWWALHKSGVHATIAGVILGAITPASPWFRLNTFGRSARGIVQRFLLALKAGDRNRAEALMGQMEELVHGTEPPLDRLQRTIHPWSGFAVLPLFALANAGVALSGSALSDALSSRITWGVSLGLLIGKPIGVAGASWLAVRLRIAARPDDMTWPHLLGVGVLAGIGFTVSLFIAELSFATDEQASEAKVGILAASLLAGVLGFLVLRLLTHPPAPAETSAAEPLQP
jgi:Na+:H+ antiporter, NhaA family